MEVGIYFSINSYFNDGYFNKVRKCVVFLFSNFSFVGYYSEMGPFCVLHCKLITFVTTFTGYYNYCAFSVFLYSHKLFHFYLCRLIN